MTRSKLMGARRRFEDLGRRVVSLLVAGAMIASQCPVAYTASAFADVIDAPDAAMAEPPADVPVDAEPVDIALEGTIAGVEEQTVVDVAELDQAIEEPLAVSEPQQLSEATDDSGNAVDEPDVWQDEAMGEVAQDEGGAPQDAASAAPIEETEVPSDPDDAATGQQESPSSPDDVVVPTPSDSTEEVVEAPAADGNQDAPGSEQALEPAAGKDATVESEKGAAADSELPDQEQPDNGTPKYEPVTITLQATKAFDSAGTVGFDGPSTFMAKRIDPAGSGQALVGVLDAYGNVAFETLAIDEPTTLVYELREVKPGNLYYNSGVFYATVSVSAVGAALVASITYTDALGFQVDRPVFTNVFGQRDGATVIPLTVAEGFSGTVYLMYARNGEDVAPSEYAVDAAAGRDGGFLVACTAEQLEMDVEAGRASYDEATGLYCVDYIAATDLFGQQDALFVHVVVDGSSMEATVACFDVYEMGDYADELADPGETDAEVGDANEEFDAVEAEVVPIDLPEPVDELEEDEEDAQEIDERPSTYVAESDDGSVRVEAVPSTVEDLPTGAFLTVENVAPETDAARHAALLEALNASVGLDEGDDAIYTDENTLLLDMAFYAPVGDVHEDEPPTVEVQPLSGAVDLSVEFLEGQLSQMGLGDEGAALKVAHLVDTGAGYVVEPEAAVAYLSDTDLVKTTAGSFSVRAFSVLTPEGTSEEDSALLDDDAKSVEVQINVKVGIDAREMYDDESFEFDLAPATEGAPMPELPEGASEHVVVASNHTNPVAFGPITFTMADLADKDADGNVTGYSGKEFTYTVHERAMEDGVDKNAGPGQAYLDHLFYAKDQQVTFFVDVTDDGELAVTYDVETIEDDDDESVALSAPAASPTLVFTNSYVAFGSISFGALKVLDGGDLTERDGFYFTLLNVDSGQIMSTVPNDIDGMVVFGDLTYTIEDLADYDEEGNVVGYSDKYFTYKIYENGAWEYEYDSEGNAIADAAGNPVKDGIVWDRHVDVVRVHVYDAGEGVLGVEYAETTSYDEPYEGMSDYEGDDVQPGPDISDDGYIWIDTGGRTNPVTYGDEEGGDTAASWTQTSLINPGPMPVFVNKYQVDDTIKLEKYYFGADTQAVFTFNLDESDAEGNVVDGGKRYTASVTAGDIPEFGSAVVEFEPITYERTGIYHYVLSEAQAPEGQSMVTDESVYLVTTVVGSGGAVSNTYQLLVNGQEQGEEFSDDAELADGALPEFYNNALIGFATRSEGDNTETYGALRSVSVEPIITKALIGGALIDGEFVFRMVDDQTGDVYLGSNDADGRVIFSQSDAGEDSDYYFAPEEYMRETSQRFNFTQPGVHTYTVTEIVGSESTVAYDPTTIKVVITVTEQDGVLVADIAYSNDRVGEYEGDAYANMFVNRVKTVKVQVTKYSRATNAPLAGAQYGLWMANLDGDDAFMGSAVSNENGLLVFDVPLQTGRAYYFKEIAAPAGHLIDPYRSDYFSVVKDLTDYVLVYEGDEAFDAAFPELTA